MLGGAVSPHESLIRAPTKMPIDVRARARRTSGRGWDPDSRERGERGVVGPTRGEKGLASLDQYRRRRS